MMNNEEEFRRYLTQFTNRIDQQLIINSLEYIEFNECSLAVEAFCDQLLELDVEITLNEFLLLYDFAIGFNASLKRVENLRSLIRTN